MDGVIKMGDTKYFIQNNRKNFGPYTLDGITQSFRASTNERSDSCIEMATPCAWLEQDARDDKERKTIRSLDINWDTWVFSAGCECCCDWRKIKDVPELNCVVPPPLPFSLLGEFLLVMLTGIIIGFLFSYFIDRGVSGNTVKSLLINHWIFLAGIFSVFWGVRSSYFFHGDSEALDQYFSIVYEFLLNFFCSFAGWACLHVLVSRFNSGNVGLTELVLFFLALLGLTGTLPQVVVKLPEAVVGMIKRWDEKSPGNS